MPLVPRFEELDVTPPLLVPIVSGVCGRFTQRWTWAQLAAVAEPFWHFPTGVQDPVPGFNLAPTQAARVIRTGGTGPELLPMRWGFPRSEGGRPAGDVINARSETAISIHMFKGAMANRRCLVPVSGFYEWEKEPDGSNQPLQIPLVSDVCDEIASSATDGRTLRR
jgi:putative SOS response-associated peptidase YedK